MRRIIIYRPAPGKYLYHPGKIPVSMYMSTKHQCQYSHGWLIGPGWRLRHLQFPTTPLQYSLWAESGTRDHWLLGEVFLMRNRSRISASSPDVLNVLIASNGKLTIGSLLRLKLVFNTAGTPVFVAKALIRS